MSKNNIEQEELSEQEIKEGIEVKKIKEISGFFGFLLDTISKKTMTF